MFRNLLLVHPRQASQRLHSDLRSSDVSSLCLPSVRHFSRHSMLRATPDEKNPQQGSSQHGKANSKQHPPNPGADMQAILNFKELGATRTVKIVVIIAICILSTAETIFWVQVIWRKYFGGGVKEDEQEAESEQGR